MAKTFNLADYIQETESKMDTMPRMTSVELHLIDPSPANFYSMEGVKSLADNIATVGLLEPPRVREKDGRYVVVSGHRRLAALRILVDRGQMDPHDKIPVFLEAEPDTGAATDKDAARIALQQLRLIYANSDNRQYSSADKNREVHELTLIFSELKRLGYEFPGTVREHVATAAHISESRAARLSVIGKKLTTPKLREAYDAGRLGENAAYEIARRNADVIGRVDELPMGMVCDMTIERLSAVLDGLEKQAAEDAAVGKAYNDGVKAMGAEPVTRSRFDTEAYLAERAEEDADYREMLLQTSHEFYKKLTGVCTRQDGIAILKKTFGARHTGWWFGGTRVCCSPKGVELSADARCISRTWTDVYDLLCTIAINGEATPAPETEDAGGASPSPTAAPETRWNIGEPESDGWYCCWATWEPASGKWDPDREFLYRRGSAWFDNERDADRCVPSQYEVHKWYRIPDDPEEEKNDAGFEI